MNPHHQQKDSADCIMTRLRQASACPDRLRGPHGPLVNGYCVLYRDHSDRTLKLTIHLHLVPRLRKVKVYIDSPHMSCWLVQGNLFALLPYTDKREAHAAKNMCGLNYNIRQYVQIEEQIYFRNKKSCFSSPVIK